MTETEISSLELIRVSSPVTVSEAVPSGTLKIQIFYFGMNVYETTEQLCSVTSCPLGPGDGTIVYTFTVPKSVPSASYTLRLLAFDQRNTQMFCKCLLLASFSFS